MANGVTALTLHSGSSHPAAKTGWLLEWGLGRVKQQDKKDQCAHEYIKIDSQAELNYLDMVSTLSYESSLSLLQGTPS